MDGVNTEKPVGGYSVEELNQVITLDYLLDKISQAYRQGYSTGYSDGIVEGKRLCKEEDNKLKVWYGFRDPIELKHG